MVAPITRGPQILGLLAVADRIGRAPFTDEDLNLLLALAGQATIAVENLRLHEEIKKANALLQEYDRLKSEFVGIVAHDFRKPADGDPRLRRAGARGARPARSTRGRSSCAR